jgi:hypothetical protein
LSGLLLVQPALQVLQEKLAQPELQERLVCKSLELQLAPQQEVQRGEQLALVLQQEVRRGERPVQELRPALQLVQV